MRHAIAMFRASTTSHEDSFGSFTSGMISFRDCIGSLRNDRSSASRASMAGPFVGSHRSAVRSCNTVVLPGVSTAELRVEMFDAHFRKDEAEGHCQDDQHG